MDLDIISKIFESIKEYFSNMVDSILEWFLIGIFKLFYAVAETVVSFVLDFASNIERLTQILVSLLNLQLVQDIFDVFMWTSFSLILLAIIYDLSQNYNTQTGRSAQRSAQTRLIPYFTGLVLPFIIEKIIRMIITFVIKLLRSTIVVYEDFDIGSFSADDFLNMSGVSTDSDILDKLVASQTVVLKDLVYMFIVLVIIIIVIITVFILYLQFFSRAGKILVLTSFSFFAIIGIPLNNGEILKETLMTIIGHLISSVFQYIMLIIFVYVMISPDKVLAMDGTMQFTKMMIFRLLLGLGIIQTAINTPEIIQSKLENATHGNKISQGASQVGNYIKSKVSS
ncbi:MAG: conjugal transfer protein TrbL family protein [Bacillota bacterium]